MLVVPTPAIYTGVEDQFEVIKVSRFNSLTAIWRV